MLLTKLLTLSAEHQWIVPDVPGQQKKKNPRITGAFWTIPDIAGLKYGTWGGT